MLRKYPGITKKKQRNIKEILLNYWRHIKENIRKYKGKTKKELGIPRETLRKYRGIPKEKPRSIKEILLKY